MIKLNLSAPITGDKLPKWTVMNLEHDGYTVVKL